MTPYRHGGLQLSGGRVAGMVRSRADGRVCVMARKLDFSNLMEITIYACAAESVNGALGLGRALVI